jgi:uncharacterized protein (TIGR01777 family)
MPGWAVIRWRTRCVIEDMVIGLTGGTGFLGRHVIDAATAAGHEVVVFSRNPSVVVAGARERRLWPGAGLPDLGGCDAVIHLAGETVLGWWTRAKREAIRGSRVDGTRRLVAALGSPPASVRALVCASAVGFYGDRGDEVLTESAAAGDGFLADVTQAWEREAEAAEAVGVRVVRARLGLVLGPDGGAWPVLRRVFRAGVGGRLGSGGQWMPWIHVRDAAALLVAAAVDGRYRGPVNTVGPEPVRNIELTRAVARALRRPAILPAPAPVMRLVLRDQARMFLDSQRVVPEAAQRLGFSFAYGTLATALEDLVERV